MGWATESLAMDKTDSRLKFLEATATLRRKCITSYETADKIPWIADVPWERAECRSPQSL